MGNVIRDYFPPLDAPEQARRPSSAISIGPALRAMLTRTIKAHIKYCGEEETEALLKLELGNIKREMR